MAIPDAYVVERPCSGPGGEADLIVGHDMHRAADGITRQLAQIEGLLDDALAGKRSVAMNQYQQSLLAAALVIAVLLGAHAAHRNRVDELEMAGIEAQRQMDFVALGGDPVAAVAEMILHIAAAVMALAVRVVEFSEYLLRALAQNVDEHVQAAPVRHAEDDLIDALIAGPLDGQIEQRNEAFAAFQRKTLGADVFLLQELFENHGVGQPRQNAQLAFAAELQPIGRPFHAFLQPLADRHIIDVHELHADRAAVGLAQAVDHGAHVRSGPTGQGVGGNGALPMRRRQAEILGVEFGREGRGRPSGSRSAAMCPRTR